MMLPMHGKDRPAQNRTAQPEIGPPGQGIGHHPALNRSTRLGLSASGVTCGGPKPTRGWLCSVALQRGPRDGAAMRGGLMARRSLHSNRFFFSRFPYTATARVWREGGRGVFFTVGCPLRSADFSTTIYPLRIGTATARVWRRRCGGRRRRARLRLRRRAPCRACPPDRPLLSAPRALSTTCPLADRCAS
jgi:hypothetical protein